MKLSLHHSDSDLRALRGWPARRSVRGFTMIEIAICLAIIGVALVGIIGVLPYGMNTQRDNREETIIGQDANLLAELIRNGNRGANDLTNYVIAITNSWAKFSPSGIYQNSGVDGYTYASAHEGGSSVPLRALYNGTNIIGLLSTPQFTDAFGAGAKAIPCVYFGGYSNHITANVRSISGLAAEKPPQDNQIMQGDTFKYHLFIANAPVVVDTNRFYEHDVWQAKAYLTDDQVFYNWYYWRATAAALATDVPGVSSVWVKVPSYPLEIARRQRDLRMTFQWPILPNEKIGGGRQTFRTAMAGDLRQDPRTDLFFYEPQTYTQTQ